MNEAAVTYCRTAAYNLDSRDVPLLYKRQAQKPRIISDALLCHAVWLHLVKRTRRWKRQLAPRGLPFCAKTISLANNINKLCTYPFLNSNPQPGMNSGFLVTQSAARIIKMTRTDFSANLSSKVWTFINIAQITHTNWNNTSRMSTPSYFNIDNNDNPPPVWGASSFFNLIDTRRKPHPVEPRPLIGVRFRACVDYRVHNTHRLHPSPIPQHTHTWWWCGHSLPLIGAGSMATRQNKLKLQTAECL